MKKIVTIGEVMMRLSPPGNQRFFQANSFDIEFGGSEANVGAALAYWGMEVLHVTAFPDHELGWAAAGRLRANGVRTDHVQYGPGRMGTYYLEHGAMQRSSQVIYDRVDSAFAGIDAKNLDWDQILEGADWLHWSGITPALSQSCADLSLEALQKAREMGVRVSGDINYRSNLWKYGKSPHEVMPKLMELTQVMIAGVRDFNQCLGEDYKSFDEVRDKAFARFGNLEQLVKTERISHSASHNTISGNIYTQQEVYSSATYEMTHVVDRVGTGDAFAGGLIYGLLHFDVQRAIEFAMAAGAIKHSVPGDTLLCSLAEVDDLAGGETSGKIRR